MGGKDLLSLVTLGLQSAIARIGVRTVAVVHSLTVTSKYDTVALCMASRVVYQPRCRQSAYSRDMKGRFEALVWNSYQSLAAKRHFEVTGRVGLTTSSVTSTGFHIA